MTTERRDLLTEVGEYELHSRIAHRLNALIGHRVIGDDSRDLAFPGSGDRRSPDFDRPTCPRRTAIHQCTTIGSADLG